MDFSGFTYLDYAVIAVLMLSTLFAFVRGFIGSFLSLAGWIIAIYLSYTLFPTIKPFLEEKMKSPVVILIAGHTVLLIGLLVIFGVLNVLATSAVKGMTAGIIDRSLGAAFGAIRGGIIVSFVFLIISTGIGIFNGVDNNVIPEEDAMPKWLSSSRSFPFMREGSQVLAGFIPDSFYERFQTVYDDISRKSMDERFVENSLQKLRKSLSPQEVKLIDSKLEESSLTQSSEEAKYSKLKELINVYESSKVEKDISGKRLLSGDELSRLRKIIVDKQAELKSAKANTEAASSSVVEIN
jgi:membrane protein required for colicin V production